MEVNNNTLASADEDEMISALRLELQDELGAAPQHDDLVGDIRLLRFLRGHSTVEGAAEAYRTMLAMREELGVEQIRESVVANELDLQKAPHLEAIQKCMSMNWDAGRTHRGDIVTIGWPGQAKVGLLLETVPDEDWLQNVLYNQERQVTLQHM